PNSTRGSSNTTENAGPSSPLTKHPSSSPPATNNGQRTTDKGLIQMTRDEIYSKVQGVLVDALGVDEEEVTPKASLIDDLGAESIDFLDIVFRLEKAFDIKIPRG